MKKIVLLISIVAFFSSVNSQTTYDIINDLPAEFCDLFYIDVVVWDCTNSCDYTQSCYTVHQFSLYPGTSDNITLSGTEWVGRVDYYGSCGVKGSYETCTTSSATTCHIEYNGSCAYVAQPNVTVDANTSSEARIH